MTRSLYLEHSRGIAAAIIITSTALCSLEYSFEGFPLLLALPLLERICFAQFPRSRSLHASVRAQPDRLLQRLPSTLIKKGGGD